MASADILPRLQQRALEADQIIGQLKTQLQQLKQSSAASISATATDEVERLTRENAALREEVEQLKRELVAAEVQNGVVQVPLPNSRPLSMEAASATVKEQYLPTPQASDASEVVNKAGTKANVKQTAVSETSKSTKPGKKQQDAKPAAAAGGGGRASSGASETIDVSRLNMRIGRIIDVQKHPDADSLYVEQVDVGEAKNRTVVSGLVKHVPMEQMQNCIAVFLLNLKPAKMRGVMSEGMVMCASSPDKVEIIDPPNGVEIGDRVTVEGYPGAPDEQLNPKKKTWEQIQPDLRIDANGVATYKGAFWKVEGKEGLFKASSVTDSAIK